MNAEREKEEDLLRRLDDLYKSYDYAATIIQQLRQEVRTLEQENEDLKTQLRISAKKGLFLHD